ncbi:MAG: metallophosphoesterase [Clostridia bacterium]|nr:metallophosphoesterase [Clostridia bacterium]
MTSIFTAFMYKLLIMFISFASLFGGVLAAPSTDDPINVLDAENVKMTAVLWGDPQLSDYMADRHQYTKNAALDIANAEADLDVLVMAGDIAENGKGAEYQLVLDYLSVADNVKHHVYTVGNHDVRLRAYSQAVDTFSEFCLASDEKLDLEKLAYKEGKLSYTYEVNGYTFVVLGTDKSVFEESYFSDECLAWFDGELAKASESGKPVFVILHQPLKHTHNVENAWNSPDDNAGTVGKQSDAILEIMNKYENLFLITGHLHMGFSPEYSIHEIGNFTGVNLPGIGPNNADGEYNESGTGYMMEVYEDKVVFRARDFNLGKYLPEFDVTVDIK